MSCAQRKSAELWAVHWLLKKMCFFGGMNFPTPVIFRDDFIGHYKDPSCQIIATSHDRFPPNGGFVREIPLISGKSGPVGEILFHLARIPKINQPGFNKMLCQPFRVLLLPNARLGLEISRVGKLQRSDCKVKKKTAVQTNGSWFGWICLVAKKTLGCPRNLGSMVSINGLEPTYKWGILGV